MEKDLVSIIIPCYNCARFLKETYLSVINQTYTSLQIVFVNDGSTDETKKILDEFKSNDSRVKVIHQSNQGPSVARNRGLAEADGEYIYFLDSDDLIHKETIRLLYEAINKYDADYAGSRYRRVDEVMLYRNLKNKKPNKKIDVYSGYDDVYTAFLANPLERSAAMKMFRLSSLKRMKEYPNVFDSTVYYGEDAYMMAHYVKGAKTLVYLKAELYFYRTVKTSLMHSKFVEKNLTLYRFLDYIKTLDPIVYKEAIKYVPSVICFACMDLIYKLRHSEYQNKEMIKKIYNDYRNNIKGMYKLKRLILSHRFGVYFTRPFMYLMIKNKLNKKQL